MRPRNYFFAVATVGAVVGALRVASVGRAGVAAPLLLLDVVIAARFWGAGPALAAAASAAAFYSYYFLPPAGFGIDDPEDWVAFLTFAVTAVVAGELASRAQRRAAEAQAGRLEIERLYQELRNAFDRASEAEAARRNEQLKAALLDAMTHNLRTPLTAIKASATALIGARVWTPEADLAPDQSRELLQVIDEESDRLNRFIEGLSGTGAGMPAQPSHPRPVQIEDIVRTALIRAETLTRDHQIVVALDENLPPLSVDAASITEVIYILLDNASKYAPPRTAITVGGTRGDEGWLRLSVSDEGPGIPTELQERVFEKFFRVASRESHDPRRGGVGLGLPIARRLVESQAGRIWIETPSGFSHGRGTTVAMVLPVSGGPPEPDHGEPVAVAAN